MENNLSDIDRLHFQRAIELALQAEERGNLPIGCVISFDGRNVAEGKNAIWVPEFNLRRHAEIEAITRVPRELWQNSHKMTLYTTLEPCLMCTATILHHGVGRVLFGSSDEYGGSRCTFGQMPPFYEERLASAQWLGPVLPEACDPLYQRVMKIEKRRRSID